MRTGAGKVVSMEDGGDTGASGETWGRRLGYKL